MNRRAFTLIEMVVVLAIAGIALSLAGPSLIMPRRDADLESVVTDARRAAIRRAEPVSVLVNASGWRVEVRRNGSPVASGNAVNLTVHPLRIDISPFGLCVVDAPRGSDAPTFDPFTCKLSVTDSRAK